MGARPRATDSARVIQVIETEALRGTGDDSKDVCRTVKQYWDLDGNLLAEYDPMNAPWRPFDFESLERTR